MIRLGNVDYTDDLLDAQAGRVEASKRTLEQRIESQSRSRSNGGRSSEYLLRPAHSEYMKELTTHRIIKRAVNARKENTFNDHVNQSILNQEKYREQIKRAAGIRSHFLSIDEVLNTPPVRRSKRLANKQQKDISRSLESGLDTESPLPPPGPLIPKPPILDDAVTATPASLEGIDLNQSVDFFASLTDADQALASALGSSSLIDLDAPFTSSTSLFDQDTPRLLQSLKIEPQVSLISPLPPTPTPPPTTTTAAAAAAPPPPITSSEIKAAVNQPPISNDSLTGLLQSEAYSHSSAENALRPPLSKVVNTPTVQFVLDDFASPTTTTTTSTPTTTTTIPLPPTRSRPALTITSPSSSRIRPLTSAKISTALKSATTTKEGPATKRLSSLISGAHAGTNVKNVGAASVVVDQANIDRRLEETQFDQYGDHKVEQYQPHGLTDVFREQQRKRQIRQS